VAQEKASKQREGLSLATLVIAAVASGTAAIVVSHLWRGGTVVAAAMTPVVVAIVREALERPMKSEAVRRSATTARRAVAGAAAVRTEGARRQSPGVGTAPTPPPPPSNGEVTQGDVLLTHPRRTYGANGSNGGFFSRLRGNHLKIAIVTGLLAFVIAAAVLTVPELLFGSAVSSGHRTTIFGGSTKTEKKSNSNGNQGDQGKQSTDQSTPPSQTTPQQTPSQPQQTPSQPQAQPQQPPSSGGGSSPAPPVPAPSGPTP
jgi:hypothetical protein